MVVWSGVQYGLRDPNAQQLACNSQLVTFNTMHNQPAEPQPEKQMFTNGWTLQMHKCNCLHAWMLERYILLKEGSRKSAICKKYRADEKATCQWACKLSFHAF